MQRLLERREQREKEMQVKRFLLSLELLVIRSSIGITRKEEIGADRTKKERSSAEGGGG